MARIQPITTLSKGDKTIDEDSSESSMNELDSNRKLVSIKFCILSIIIIAVTCSVFIQSIIWILSFSISLQEMSDSIVSLKQDKLISYVDQTFNQFVIASQTAKYQIMNSFTNVSDINTADSSIASFTLSETTFHKSIMKELTVYNYESNAIGYVINEPLIKVFISPISGITVKLCVIFPACPIYLATLPPTSDSAIANMIYKKPGQPFFTHLYELNGLPMRFVGLVNSKENSQRAKGYDWYLKMAISVSDLTFFLKNVTQGENSGSFGLIIETSSQIVVATSYPDSFNISTTVDQMDDNSRNLYHWVNQSYPNFQLPCNSFGDVSNTFYKISVYRYCTQTGLDWIFAVTIPRWTFIGNMVIAIIVGIVCGIMIILGGTFLGIYSSYRISKPFWNLIELFDSLSRMELDLVIVPSRFTEISQLQQGFSQMVTKIRQYRAFIPSHLLSQLEHTGDNTAVEQEAVSESTYRKSTNSAAKSKYGMFSSVDLKNSLRKSVSDSKSSMFKIGMESKDISACLIYLDGIEDWFSILDNNEVIRLMSELFEILQQTSSKSGAYLGSFENQSIVISLNSVSEVKQHCQKSLLFSFKLYDRLQQLSKKWKNDRIFEQNSDLIQNFSFRIAVHSQTSKCGNYGTRESKVFTIMSSLSQNLQRMMKHAMKFNISFIISEIIHSQSEQFSSRFVGRKQFLLETSCSLISKQKGQKINLFEIGELQDTLTDEWMYELKDKERKNRWVDYNKAFSYYLQETQLEVAKNIMKDFMEHNPNDLPAKYLYKKIKKRKIQQELPFGALEKIENWRRGEYWSRENEELFQQTTEKLMREKLNQVDDQFEEVDKCVRRALLTSRNDICALMISVYFNHAFYDINYGKCFGVKNVSDFYIFFQFFYRLIKSTHVHRLLRYIKDKPEDVDTTNIRNSYIYSILFNSNNPLTSFLDIGFDTCKKPTEDENYKFSSYSYNVELVNERYRTEQINFDPFVKINENTKQVGCYVYNYNAAYPYLTTNYGTDLYLPKDYPKLLNEFEKLFVSHLFRTSIVRPFLTRVFYLYNQENNPWYQGRNILNTPYSIRLYFQKRVQKSIDFIYKKLKNKHTSCHVDLSIYPTREEMEHLFNENVTKTATLLEDPYIQYSEMYFNLMKKMWNRYKSVKFHKEKLFIRAIDKCFRRYINLFILSQPSYIFFTETRISIEKVENRSCDIIYFGIGLLLIPYITELVEYKISNTIESNEEDYEHICKVIERMSTQLGFANIPFISKP
ncbi:predicted protein [Naegleria gruberi]|uniref:Predicted protein n=1 Tax=Naegleria gruberi TaxID=5762 RepID=D2V827_NAEGR|nr:uncharacterized protein NAEGRDRAFT_65007 [Naegleria gruberi]EFC47106.1 predicted protein [Naegleria gruberi]|eukprot:XP_002679850.1 predicted protein [Naegleria gruberi strain NEG-M]